MEIQHIILFLFWKSIYIHIIFIETNCRYIEIITIFANETIEITGNVAFRVPLPKTC